MYCNCSYAKLEHARRRGGGRARLEFETSTEVKWIEMKIKTGKSVRGEGIEMLRTNERTTNSTNVKYSTKRIIKVKGKLREREWEMKVTIEERERKVWKWEWAERRGRERERSFGKEKRKLPKGRERERGNREVSLCVFFVAFLLMMMTMTKTVLIMIMKMLIYNRERERLIDCVEERAEKETEEEGWEGGQVI